MTNARVPIRRLMYVIPVDLFASIYLPTNSTAGHAIFNATEISPATMANARARPRGRTHAGPVGALI